MYVKCRGRIERKVENTPCVFRPGRSTADEIFTLQQIFGKSWEYAKDVYTCFGNLEKAYDQVPREKRVLWEYGVRGRLFLAVKSLYFCLCRRIMSQLFTVCVWHRQGCVLSPLHFLIIASSMSCIGSYRRFFSFTGPICLSATIRIVFNAILRLPT